VDFLFFRHVAYVFGQKSVEAKIGGKYISWLNQHCHCNSLPNSALLLVQATKHMQSQSVRSKDFFYFCLFVFVFAICFLVFLGLVVAVI
jgi:hypothetical protein